MALSKQGSEEKHVWFGEAEEYMETSIFQSMLAGEDDQVEQEEEASQVTIPWQVVMQGSQMDRVNFVKNAVLNDDVDLIKEVVASHPDLVQSCSPHGEMTLLHIAAKYGAIKVVQFCCESNLVAIDERTKDFCCMTPLYWAIREGHMEVVEYLLAEGADSVSVNHYQDSSVYVAVSFNQVAILQRLLERGCDGNASNKESDTPLFLAVRQQSLCAIQGLIGRVDLHAANHNSESALHVAVQTACRPEIFHILLESGFDVNINVGHKRHLLHYAITQQQFALAQILLPYVKDKSVLNDALYFAAKENCLDIVQRLVSAGGDPNTNQRPSRNGESPHTFIHGTALSVAVASRNIKMIHFLLQHGADPRIDCPLYKVLQMCKNYAMLVASRLQQSHRQWYVFPVASVTDVHLLYSQIISNFVHYFPGIVDTPCPETETTALWKACSFGCLCLVIQLLQSGAQVHVSNNEGTTLLQMVVLNCTSNYYLAEWRKNKMNHLAQTLLHFITSYIQENWIYNFLADSAQCANIPQNIKSLLAEKSANPSSLMQLSRSTILSCLPHGCRDLTGVHLPPLLLDYIQLKDLHFMQYEMESELQQPKKNLAEGSLPSWPTKSPTFGDPSTYTSTENCLCLLSENGLALAGTKRRLGSSRRYQVQVNAN